jgi:hypothetical protein
MKRVASEEPVSLQSRLKAGVPMGIDIKSELR